MQEDYPDQLVAVSWNVDHADSGQEPPEPLRRSVLEKLRELNIHCRNVMAREPIREVLDRYRIFGLPAMLVFGQDGQLVRVFEGAYTFDKDVVPLVRTLLDGQPAAGR